MSVQSAISTKQKKSPGVISTGVALFSMFFGAGNLIFPILIGKSAGSEAPIALLGLMISAILFPLLGLIAMMLYEGSLDRFLDKLGKTPAFILLLSLQVVQGPLCLARLFTLMHASIKSYIAIPLFPFTLLIAAVLFWMAYSSQRLMALLGRVLTPFLIISIGTLVIAGLFAKTEPLAPSVEGASYHFVQGLKGGYMTMDLVAAILFATVILPFLSSQEMGIMTIEEKRRIARKKMLGASCIAAILLMFSYLGLCLLSAHHAGSINARPEELLQIIAVKVLGPKGAFVSAIAVFLACLTTAVALAVVFANYLRSDIVKEKITAPISLGVTVIGAALITNLGFDRILKFTGPILEILYPALIMLCVFNILQFYNKSKWLKAPVFLAALYGVVNFYLNS